MILVVDNLDDFGNYIAATLHQHPIADLHSEPINLVLVMQRRALHSRSADRYRTQCGQRSQLAGSSDLYEDVFDLSDTRTRCVLVGDSPTRGFAGKPKLPPQLRRIYFDDDAVDFIRELLALSFHLVDEFQNLVEVVRPQPMRVHFETTLFERLQRFKVARQKSVPVPQ